MEGENAHHDHPARPHDRLHAGDVSNRVGGTIDQGRTTGTALPASAVMWWMEASRTFKQPADAVEMVQHHPPRCLTIAGFNRVDDSRM